MLFQKNKKKENEPKREITKPKYYNFLSVDVEEKYLKQYWTDNNYQIPLFNSWEELYSFLKDDSKTIAQKLEVLKNLFCIEPLGLMHKENNPIPDYFWQDTSLDRKVRVLCRIKSTTYSHMSIKDYPIEEDYYYDLFIKDLDEDLFLGSCELMSSGLSVLLDCEKVTQKQKEQIVRSAMNFKASCNLQKNDYNHEYILLASLEKDCFNEEFKNEIYEKAKQNMLLTGNYASKAEDFKYFFYRFYKDESVSIEDKVKIINKALPDTQGNNYSNQYLFYLGNKNIPSFIQRIVLNHFVSATGYNLEHSHPALFKNINTSNIVNLLANPKITDDLKIKLINSITNPVLLCYCIVQNEIDDNIVELLKTKLETMKIPETKEVLEIIKLMLTADTQTIKRRLFLKQEQ